MFLLLQRGEKMIDRKKSMSFFIARVVFVDKNYKFE